MECKRKRNAKRLLTGALALCMVSGAAFIDFHPAAAAVIPRPGMFPSSEVKTSISSGISANSRRYASMAVQCKETESVEAKRAEYLAAGVTTDGKHYSYQGDPVHIFWDAQRPDRSSDYCTLDWNPAGTVNIRIVRDEKNEIVGAAYMTEEEAETLVEASFGDHEDVPRDGNRILVDWKTIANGETLFLGEYTLSDGDTIRYDISAETGNGMQVFFAKDEQRDPVFWSVHNLRQLGEPLKCAADFIVEPPAMPGTYQMFLYAADGTLRNVKGAISIEYAAAT